MTEQTDETETAAQEAQEPPQEPAKNDTDVVLDAQDAPDGPDGPDEPETFPRKVVEDLRRENAKYRDRAKRADDLGERLQTQLVAATGRLADPTDLQYDEAHLDDEDALSAAVDELLSRKPHLASRRPSGDVGQGATGSGDTVDLAGILRSRAG